MVKNSKVSALVLAMLLGSVSGIASAATPGGPSGAVVGGSVARAANDGEFAAGMTKEKVAAVVKAKLAAGKTLADIVAEAKEAGVPAADLTASLIAEGQPAVEVVTAVVKANPAEKTAIQDAAIIAAPGQTAAITSAINGATASNGSTGQSGSSNPQLTQNAGTPGSSGGGASPL